MASELDITVAANEALYWRFTLTYKPTPEADPVPFDLTGYTICAWVREYADLEATVLAELDVDYIDRADGMFALKRDVNVDGELNISVGAWSYDLVLRHSTGQPDKLWTAAFTVTGGVTLCP